VNAIVLAGGSSVRMGSPKALLPWRGEPFLSIVLRQVRAAGVWPVVVLGEHAAAILAAVDLRAAQVVVNEDPARGMFSSVKLGAAACGGAALVCLVDQPLVRAETFRLLAPEPGPREARVAAYLGSPGHPVALGRELVAALPDAPDATLEAFLGARASRALVETSDPAVLQNVNTPEAYAALPA
jgi:nicotine blue oxidoreductase